MKTVQDTIGCLPFLLLSFLFLCGVIFRFLLSVFPFTALFIASLADMVEEKSADATNSGSRQKKRRRRVFVLLMLLLTYVVCEGIALFGLHFTGAGFTFAGFRGRQHGIASGALASAGASEVIHPYFGWVHNPQVSPAIKIFGRSVPVNSLGFQDVGESVHPRSEGEFILGIAGGSVAWQSSFAGEEIFRQGLQNHAKLEGKKIRIVRMAMSGYKQPQQLMAYSYIKVLGGHFDAVVNIDGYNEAALAVAENGHSGTSVVYPRSWKTRMITVIDPRQFESSDRLLRLRAHRQRIAQNVVSSRFAWSPLVNLVWHIRDQMALRELTSLGMEVSKSHRGSFVRNGPVESGLTDEDIDNAAVDVWMRSSIQMHHLCASSNTPYLHVLQPNQYMTDSKPTLSALELEEYYDPEMETSQAVQRLYPVMCKRGEELQRMGIAFSNQTQLFAGESDTIYCDYFCHYNERGNRMLARAVLKDLLALLDSRTEVPQQASR